MSVTFSYKFKMVLAVRITVSVIIMLTLAMYLVSVSTDYWQKTSYKNNAFHKSVVSATHSGIWSGCYVKTGMEYCGHIHSEKRKYFL